MNIPVLIVACITLLAVVAHVIGGTRETAAIEPDPSNAKLTTHWVQAMCAFQMLSVDLLVVALALFAIALKDFGEFEPLAIQLFSGLFFLWGIVWIAQVQWLKRPAASLLRLPHWTVWFVCSGLLYFGS